MTRKKSQDVGTLADWDGPSYAANTAHHRLRDRPFLDSIPFAGADRILDIGCGSGDFTRILADLVPAGRVIGLEPNESLLTAARAVAAANQEFFQAPAQQLAELDLPEIDVAVSRAVLHWIPVADHPAVLAAIKSILRPAGLLRLEFGGAGNISEVAPWLDKISTDFGGPTLPWTFLEPGAYLPLVEAAGFSLRDGWVRLEAQRREFDRQSIVGWLESQVLQAYEAPMNDQQRNDFHLAALSDVDSLRRPDGSYDLTYVRLDIKAHA